MKDRTKGMVLKMIESVWGNLRTKEARMAWAKAQVPKNKINDAIFRKWLTDNNIPDDIARRAWAKGSRQEAIKMLADNAKWIKHYHLEEEVKAAFRKYTPK